MIQGRCFSHIPLFNRWRGVDKMYDLEDYERVIWREEDSVDRFKEYFDIDFNMTMVSWTTTFMIVNGFSNNYHSHERLIFSIFLWNEYYKENK